MYLLIEIVHTVISLNNVIEEINEKKEINYMFKNDILRIYSQKDLGVLRGDF